MAEMHKIIDTILFQSAQLDRIGTELVDLSERMARLKAEIYLHQETEKKKMLSQQSGDKVTLDNGEQIKVTDSVRESLSKFGIIVQCAEYEGLKRKKEGLEIAVRALVSAQSGYQSVANILRQEMQTLQYQP